MTDAVLPGAERGSLRRDVIANVLGKLCSGAVSVAFVPLYIRVLGIEAFGLVAVYTTLRNLCAAFDLGLTTTLNRELARGRASGASGARDLARTLEVLYWCLAALIVLVCGALAPWIAHRWVQVQALAPDRVEAIVRLMGVVIAFEWLLAFYAGGLLGLGRQVLYNAWYAALSTLRYAGVLPVLWYASPTIEAFFVWQAGVGLLSAVAIGRLLWRSLPAGEPARVRAATLRAVWRFAAGMSAVSLTGVAVSQLDRVILTRLVSLTEFGYYGVAVTISGALIGLVGPIFSAIFPRLSASVATDDRAGLAERYHQGCQLMTVAVLPAASVIGFFAPAILAMWTHDATLTREAYPLLRVTTLSTALNSLLFVPYALLLAHGHTRLTLWTQVLAIVVLTPVTVAATMRYGVLGATVGWAAYNLLNVVIGMHLVHRLFLPGERRRWYLHDVGRPGAMAVSTVAVGYWLMPPSLTGVGLGLWLALVSACSVLATAWSMPRIWAAGLDVVRRVRPTAAAA